MKHVSSLASLLLLLSWVHPPQALASFGIDDFKRAIETSGASTLQQAVPILSKNLKSNFTAVYHSNSVQAATERDPRVIFWDESSDFAATFSGAGSGDDRDAIEMFQFDPKTARFEFLRQTFPLQRNSAGQPDFSPKRETSCLACHGADPRPIWAEYPTWTGVFGSDNDLLHSPEKELFENFVAYAGTSPLYGSLFPPSCARAGPRIPTARKSGRSPGSTTPPPSGPTSAWVSSAPA